MKQSIQKLWRYAKPARAAFIVSSLIMSLRYFVINYLTAYLTGRITEAAQHMDVAGLLRDVAGFIACLIPFLFVDAVSKYAHDMSTQKIGNALRQSAYSRILRAPLWQAETLGASRSQMLSRLNNDMNVVESLYRSSLLAPLIFGIAGVGAFVSIWWVRPSIAVYLFALGASSFALQYAMSRRKKRVATRIQALMASLLTAASECLTDRPVIRLMNAYRGVLGHTERLRKTYLAAGREDAAIQSGADMVVGGASLLQYVGVMLISIFCLSKGQMEAAQIMVVLQLSGLVVSGFTLVGNALIALRGYLPALDRVEEILTLDEEDLETGANTWKNLEKEGIRASDAVLCFSPEKKLTLKDPLDIPAGRISALCGASGCGKTSFIKTLIGFYPYEGDISIAGAPLNAYSKKYLREQIAYLSQQNILIAGSIKENLLIGGHAAVTEEEIKEALRICTCDEWLGDMPDGLYTMLDEGGLRLSGGQRQMLIIARALLQKKPILLMDETFSAIDKKRSVRIIENIRRAYPEKTILLISHEEEIVRCCDEQVMVSSM